MTHRERMLAAMRGRATDRIPWAPRMDLWCVARRARGTLPPRFEGLDIAQIADELGVGCRALAADYTRPGDRAGAALRGLGIRNHPDHCYRVEVRDLRVEHHDQGGTRQTTIHTPAGPVTMRHSSTQQMTVEGITIPFIEKYPIVSEQDFEPVARVFEHLEVIPTPAGYAAFDERIGPSGVAIASGPGSASPMHLLLHELMHMEEFYVLYAEQRPAMEDLAHRMEPFFHAVLEAQLACDAQVIFWGANYDQDTTWPPFFREHILPWLQPVSRRAHAAGKLVLTHTDGENRALLADYPACGFDVAEAVCPRPMTSCTLAELRHGMGPNVTVWGGIPCVALLDQSMDAGAFEACMDETFAELGTGERLILGVSDNVPPDANLDRLEQIKHRIDAFGPVRPRPSAARDA